MIELLTTKALAWLLPIAVGVAGLFAAWAKGRSDARRDADLRRAESFRRAKEAADAAAAGYRRDGGAAERLREGNF